MKKIVVLLISFLPILSWQLIAQTAEGGCTDITITDIPPYPTVYFTYVGYKNCKDGGSPYYEGCDEGGEIACCRVIVSGGPTTPRFWLEQLQPDGSWLEVAGPQFSTTFSDVDKGVYRVKCQRPNIAENVCAKDEFGNPTQPVRICLFNTLGQFIGYWGTWNNAPFGNQYPITYSNTVVVGATTAEDISYTFVDVPETGSEQTYDFGEIAIMDVSECKNYDLWWLSIGEDGPDYQRYKSNGWTNGTVPNDAFNLTGFWSQGDGWELEAFHSYKVQFVIENSKCRNGIEQNPPPTWNNLARTFFICPAGSGCRFDVGEKEIAIVINPNPANGTIWLQNFEPDLDRDYVLTIIDITGKVFKNVPLTANTVDISDLQSGMFIVNIWREGELLFSSKLVVNQ